MWTGWERSPGQSAGLTTPKNKICVEHHLLPVSCCDVCLMVTSCQAQFGEPAGAMHGVELVLNMWERITILDCYGVYCALIYAHTWLAVRLWHEQYWWAEVTLREENPTATKCLVYPPPKLHFSKQRDAVWWAKWYIAIQIHVIFEIGLPSILRVCICCLAKMALELCQHHMKLTWQFVCWKCLTITAVVNFDQEVMFHLLGR